MLLLGSRLIGTPVMSLQTGSKLALLSSAIINPANLHILAYQLDGPLLTEQPSFLRTADIREYGRIGVIIDSSDELIGLDDVLKVKELYDLRFALINLPVYDDQGSKLGKVSDYTLDVESFVIQQLNVQRGFFKSLNETGLLIHRSQIVEINDTRIVVRSATKKVVEPVMESVRHEFVNPFRQPSQPEAEAIDNSN